MASTPAANQPGVATAPPGDAKNSALAFGGNPTGRETRFKFPAGTPEGDKERRDDDAARKKAARAIARNLVAPPPLPSAGAPVPGSQPAPGAVVAPGLPNPPIEPFILWKAEDVQASIDELVELSEAKRIEDFIAIAKEAKLPEKLIRMIESDAAYPASSKKGLKESLAACVAKWLNRAGISARNKEETLILFHVATIRLHGRRMKAHLLEVIDEQKRKVEPKPEESSILNLTNARKT
jgi:hypothetical protein